MFSFVALWYICHVYFTGNQQKQVHWKQILFACCWNMNLFFALVHYSALLLFPRSDESWRQNFWHQENCCASQRIPVSESSYLYQAANESVAILMPELEHRMTLLS